MNAKVGMIGLTFGKATVLSEVQRSNGRRMFLCSCVCGNEFSALGENLRSGNTNSCGCFASQRAREAKTTHGDSVGRVKSPEMIAWQSLKGRCINPKNPRYKDYGGRGIIVCKEWIESFEVFLQDMGRRPSPQHSIERKSTNGDYTPSNCVWATPDVQGNNKRNNILLEYAGVKRSLAQWATILKRPYSLLYWRHSVGWSVHDILFKESKKCQS